MHYSFVNRGARLVSVLLHYLFASVSNTPFFSYQLFDSCMKKSHDARSSSAAAPHEQQAQEMLRHFSKSVCIHYWLYTLLYTLLLLDKHYYTYIIIYILLYTHVYTHITTLHIRTQVQGTILELRRFTTLQTSTTSTPQNLWVFLHYLKTTIAHEYQLVTPFLDTKQEKVVTLGMHEQQQYQHYQHTRRWMSVVRRGSGKITYVYLQYVTGKCDVFVRLCPSLVYLIVSYVK